MKNFFRKIIILILEFEARLVLLKYKPKIVAVTGSVGKTTTKDAIYSVLSTTFFVRKSIKSFNSEIGVPLTILGLPNGWNSILLWLKNIIDGFILFIVPHKYPEWLILEIGADRPGDIECLTKWIRPDIAVVTRLSDVPVHIEFFDSAEAVRQEKSFLVRAVKKTGMVILNVDDKLVSSFRNFTKSGVITYGYEETAVVKGSKYEIKYKTKKGIALPAGISFLADLNGQTVPVSISGSIGKQHVYSSLAALAVGYTLKIDALKASEALNEEDTPKGRMKLVEGKHNSVIIDDSYNSSPVAVREALMTINDLNVVGRKIAVLGDMLELGNFTVDEHYKIGLLAKESVSELFTVGVRSKKTCEAMNDNEQSFKCTNFADSVEAASFLNNLPKQGDIILVKGSQGTRMEKVVEVLMSKQNKKKEILVRQEDEWKRRQ